jgi:hypothetical protein
VLIITIILFKTKKEIQSDDLSRSGEESLKIYDIQGRFVRTFPDNYRQTRKHSLRRNRCINIGQPVSGGPFSSVLIAEHF